MTHLKQWDPEDPGFWEKQGKRIANRNLWISVPNLFCGFAVWLYWSIITVQMKIAGFPFDNEQLFTLSAIAGLAGATLRIPNSFLIAISGGRNVIAVTSALLLLPSISAGLALQNLGTPYGTFVIIAALSGIGGGAFASSMSNISFFFPKRVAGSSLGINAGLGNLGVSAMQVLLPFVMAFPLFGALGGEGIALADGSFSYAQNAGLVWVPILIAVSLAAWFGMSNLPMHKIGSTPGAVVRILVLTILGFCAAAGGLYLLLTMAWSMWIVLPITIVLTLALMRFASPRAVRESLKEQFGIFRLKHNWVMTYLYTMTFGSFIGYAAAFPLLIKVVFGELPDGTENPNAPNPYAYAWLGAFVGSLIRPVGGWLSDKFGGARVTHWDTIIMIGAALGVAHFVIQAGQSQTPEDYFLPFLLLFLLLFITTGIGNGSTFRMIAIIFPSAQAGPVLGWTSSVAAYGAFIIPKVFGVQVKAGTPQYALYGFALYYTTCLLLNWWFYARKSAEIKC